MKACQGVRNHLLRQAPAAGGEGITHTMADHLAECPACRGFAARLDAVRGSLRAHHAGFEPDRAFASRVRARLSGDASAAMGLAALRLLPVTAAVLLVLLGFSLANMVAGSRSVTGSDPITSTARAEDETLSPEDQWVAWVLTADEETSP